MHRVLQPVFHDEVVALDAPTQAWSGPDGEMRDGVHGVHHGDWRFVRALSLTLDGAALEPLAHEAAGGVATFTAMARSIDDATKDPRVLVQRQRTVSAGRVAERVQLVNASSARATASLEVAVVVGVAPLHSVRAGTPQDAPAELLHEGDRVVATAGPRCVRLQAVGATSRIDDDTVRYGWDVDLAPGETMEIGWEIEPHDPALVVVGASATLPRLAPSGDPALDRWAEAALSDLEALQLATPASPDDRFLAAGAPWYCTLFGRDAILSARMLLPLTAELARGTLRTLAARQGTRVDAIAAEAPGKILHELRSGVYEVPREGLVFPPVYYGTIDATPLWVVLLHDAWRAGLDDADVRALLPAARAALEWMRDHGDADGDGFLEYIDESGTGLANQGWKDSADAVRWHSGEEAVGPIALCEAQAYACEAALAGAALLDAFGVPGEGERWREFATAMQSRFRARFWVERDGIRFPAIALDGRKRPVDALSSNIGHLLGTGLLSQAEEAEVAALLVSDRLHSGWGLRTLAADEGGFWPLSYHCGSVWPHDTAIAIAGLMRAGFPDEARRLARSLVDAAAAFGGRVPELWSGEPRGGALVPGAGMTAGTTAPAAYPTACRPQAWSAASVVIAHAALTA